VEGWLPIGLSRSNGGKGAHGPNLGRSTRFQCYNCRVSLGLNGPEQESEFGVFDLATLVTGLSAVPPADLDPFLDAAARCFARHGLRRTSVQDVARELGVDRTTVYRQVGTIPQQARLLAARELQRMVASIPGRAPQPVGPTGVIEIMASVIDDVRSHPVIAKLLADDTDTITLSTLSELPPLLERVATGLAPMLTAAMSAGVLAPRDPIILAEWLIRLVVTLVLVPPNVNLRTFLSELLLPALTP
jgi:AcrR family transcriptional regulator